LHGVLKKLFSKPLVFYCGPFQNRCLFYHSLLRFFLNFHPAFIYRKQAIINSRALKRSQHIPWHPVHATVRTRARKAAQIQDTGFRIFRVPVYTCLEFQTKLLLLSF